MNTVTVTSLLNSKALSDVFLSEVSGIPLLAIKCLREVLGEEKFLFVFFILGGMDIRFPTPSKFRRILEQSLQMEQVAKEHISVDELETKEARKVLEKISVNETYQTFQISIPVRLVPKKRKLRDKMNVV